MGATITKNWRDIGHELFADEFDDIKGFNEAFPESISVYLEVAKRVTRRSVEISVLPSSNSVDSSSDIVRIVEQSHDTLIDQAAYKVMYDAHMRDTVNNDTAELMSLAREYELLSTGETE